MIIRPKWRCLWTKCPLFFIIFLFILTFIWQKTQGVDGGKFGNRVHVCFKGIFNVFYIVKWKFSKRKKHEGKFKKVYFTINHLQSYAYDNFFNSFQFVIICPCSLKVVTFILIHGQFVFWTFVQFISVLWTMNIEQLVLFSSKIVNFCLVKRYAMNNLLLFPSRLFSFTCFMNNSSLFRQWCSW